ncbi:leucine-rich repeat-containing protein [Cavenderia fasciculata]|uniref:Leucine-rich repeat-containing protein n=1 Tax=Cavenderia fasciculata TaxID=261658 RepID=F4QEE2_CACFS|nr:leucine-rich repeat-containing protein [Cavenderia fasciculata]EGG14089.1 leucine-rich repeat-containing protein [Cavenderia fasciculata]|eukprot:XP_004350797.1 leucine-rich repeat-containing protein [Cavenderia fasciculata]
MINNSNNNNKNSTTSTTNNNVGKRIIEKKIDYSKYRSIGGAFNINDLPHILIREILEMYQMHENSVIKQVMVDGAGGMMSMYDTTTIGIPSRRGRMLSSHVSPMINNVVLRLSLVCKLWSRVIVPSLPRTKFSISTRNELESFIKLSHYSITYPMKFIPTSSQYLKALSHMYPAGSSKAAANLARYGHYPYQFQTLYLVVSREQIAFTPTSIIPMQIYDLLIPSHDQSTLEEEEEDSSDVVSIQENQLKSIVFKTNVDQDKEDVEYLLRAILNNSSLTKIKITGPINANCYSTLAKILAKPNCAVQTLCLASTFRYRADTSGLKDTRLDFVQALEQCKSLTKLDMSKIEFANDSGALLSKYLQVVTGKNGLVHLSLDKTALRDLPASVMLASVPSTTLRYLKGEFGQSTITAIIPYLQENKSLETLDLCGSSVRAGAIEERLFNAIAEHKNLRTVILSGLNIVKQNPPPQEFPPPPQQDLPPHDNWEQHNNWAQQQWQENNQVNGEMWGNQEMDEENTSTSNIWQDLASYNFDRMNFMPKNDNYTHISLANFKLTVKESKQLFAHLKTHHHGLVSLDVSNNQLEGCHQELIACIVTNPTLHSLNLANNRLGQVFPHSANLLTALKLNKYLTRVDISSNGIRDTYGALVADYIQSNKVVKHLAIGGNSFGLPTAHKLQSALSINKTLLSFSLQSTELDVIGLECILSPLAFHPNLTIANLRNTIDQSNIDFFLSNLSIGYNFEELDGGWESESDVDVEFEEDEEDEEDEEG